MKEEKITAFLEKIELLRRELEKITADGGLLTSHEVVKKSQELDKFLTKYYLLIKENTSKE